MDCVQADKAMQPRCLDSVIQGSADPHGHTATLAVPPSQRAGMFEVKDSSGDICPEMCFTFESSLH